MPRVFKWFLFLILFYSDNTQLKEKGMDKFEEHLVRTRMQLLNEISSLSYDEFNRRFELNKWSIAQVCHHLLITETLFTKAIMYGLNQKNLTETQRKPIQLVSDKSKKFQAPKIFDVQDFFDLLDVGFFVDWVYS
jgi:uncharacterized damage-inducible protein DinB